MTVDTTAITPTINNCSSSSSSSSMNYTTPPTTTIRKVLTLEEILTIENKSNWSNPSYWESTFLSKELSISTTDYKHNNNESINNINNYNLQEEHRITESYRKRLLEDGYALVDEIQLLPEAEDTTSPTFDKMMLLPEEDTAAATNNRLNVLTDMLKRGITKLCVDCKLPAIFILLSDEVWEYAHIINKTILSKSTHSKNIFNFDILAWYIDPTQNEAGFSPHRDRQPEGEEGDNNTLSNSFHPNNDNYNNNKNEIAVGESKYVTLWVALSDATPENSCLYVIPKQYDPGYSNGDIDDGDDDPLRRALPTKESYQNIRAIPRRAGQSVMFTHRLLHWGSKGNPREKNNKPRIAISFVCSDPEFERPYINPKYFSSDNNNKIVLPPFRIRLLLICSQLLIYYQRFRLSKKCIRACYEYCKQHEQELDKTYRGKVGIEFVKAMKETTTTTSADDNNDNISENNNNNNKGITTKVDVTRTTIFNNNSDDDDDDDEAMLEEMLEAEEKGYGEFADDYDDNDNDNETTTAVAEPIKYDDEDNNCIVNDSSFDDEEEEADEGALFRKRTDSNNKEEESSFDDDEEEEADEGALFRKRTDSNNKEEESSFDDDDEEEADEGSLFRKRTNSNNKQEESSFDDDDEEADEGALFRKRTSSDNEQKESSSSSTIDNNNNNNKKTKLNSSSNSLVMDQ